MQRFKLIIFDLDGTLADTIYDLSAAAEYICQKYNSSIKVDDLIAKKSIGNGLRLFLERIFIHYSIRPNVLTDDLNEMKKFYFANSCNKTVLYDDTVKTLEFIAEQNIDMVVATMKPQEPAEKILKNYNIFSKFKMVMGGDKMPEPKPSAKIVEFFRNRFCVDYDEILVVGDGMTDIDMASNAHVKSVALLNGYGDKTLLVNSNATYKFEKISQIISVLKN